jgi:hypothetical protein
VEDTLIDVSDLELQLRELSKEQFESLIHQFLMAKYPTADIKRVDGTGGDEGIDSFSGILNSGPAIWQSKHFSNRLGGSQKRQVLKSIKAAFKARTPVLWTLCVPINFRTIEHAWFQSNVITPYGGPERIKLVTAAEIIQELIQNRKLRDAFFPDNSMSSIVKIREIAMGTEGITSEQRGELTVEYANQYLESKMGLDPRLDPIVSIGGNTQLRQSVSLPGLVMSVHQGERTTHYVARDIQAFNLNPDRFTISVGDEFRKSLESAMDLGLPFKAPAGGLLKLSCSSPLIQSLFEDKDPTLFSVEVNPLLPKEITTKIIPMRIVAGIGVDAKEIPYLPFRIARRGRLEVTLLSNDRLPLEITLKLRLMEQEGAHISFSPKVKGADAKELNEVLQFLDELERSQQVEVFSLDPPALLLRAMSDFKNGINLSIEFKQLISDASKVAQFFSQKLYIPEKIYKKDEDTLLMLKRIASGDQFFDANVNSALKKDLRHKDRVLEFINGGAPSIRFDNRGTQVSLFGQQIEIGPVTFEGVNVQVVSPEKTLEAYLAAPEGADVPWEINCQGPCRFIYGELN